MGKVVPFFIDMNHKEEEKKSEKTHCSPEGILSGAQRRKHTPILFPLHTKHTKVQPAEDEIFLFESDLMIARERATRYINYTPPPPPRTHAYIHAL